MSINVYNSSLTNQLWYTDKCRITTTTTSVTYQVYATALGDATALGNIYANNESVGTNEIQYVYVGVGNYLTITGSGFTAQEIGTASSAQAGSGNFAEQFIPAPASSGSAQFNGSNYLSVAGGAATAMGTGNFTWECWVYPTSSTGYQAFIDTRTNPLGGGDTTGFYFGTNNNTLTPMYYTSVLQLASSINITLNAWNHVALTRNSGTVTLWVNGASGGTKSDTTNLTEQRVFVGGDAASGGLTLTGSISNLRMVKGVAVYTGAFTVPTAPLATTQSAGTNISAITGTQTSLLLNTVSGVNFLVDSSTNNFTVTNNGAVTSSALTPF